MRPEPRHTGIIVTDAGFSDEDWEHGFHNLDALPPHDKLAVHLDSDTDVHDVLMHIATIALIRIHFPSFTDGRGFSLARQLRLNRFTGRLRAQGHIIADQYAMARRSGFDEIEIDQSIAKRQPESHWLARAAWQKHNYQSRLRSGLRVNNSIDNR